MSLRDEFRDFVFRGNVVDLAVGVIIGTAFGKIVTAFVEDLVMPVISVLLPAGAWRELVLAPLPKMQFKVGHLLASLIDFVIVATVLFFVLVKLVSLFKKKAPPPAKPATKVCPECLESIPEAARRCRYCTTALILAPATPGAAGK
jgi:large conductance mechanosensitive channel